MEPSEITKIIEEEIAGRWNISNAHRVDLKKCLVKPEKKTYEDGVKDVVIREMWLVLEEYPETHAGYEIVFDESKKKFGLATTDVRTNSRIFLGTYGSFLETLEAM